MQRKKKLLLFTCPNLLLQGTQTKHKFCQGLGDSACKASPSPFLLICGIFIILFGLAGCSPSSKKPVPKTNTSVTGLETEYDSQMLGMIKVIDREQKTVSFYDINEDREFSINYNGTTSITNEYGKEMSISELVLGQIMDVYYLAGENRIVKMNDSPEAFVYRGIDRMAVNTEKDMIKIGSRNYEYGSSLVVTDGEELLSMIDVNKKDELTIRGIGSYVYSICITTGHGYVRFTNYEDFVGGYVTVGGHMENVTEGMLMVAREGSYRLVMENGELVGTKNITVLRDKEITVDMGEYHIEPERIGQIKFLITPSDSELYINGIRSSYTAPLRLNYGRHKIEVIKDGYQSFTGVLTVAGGPAQNIEIVLAKENEKTDVADAQMKPNITIEGEHNTKTQESETEEEEYDEEDEEIEEEDAFSESSDSSSSLEEEDSEEETSIDPTEAATSNQTYVTDKEHKMTVKAPANAQLYLDGNLKGTVPLELPKEIGTHTITLYRTGYMTKSYTVEVEDDGEDLILSFPDLARE